MLNPVYAAWFVVVIDGAGIVVVVVVVVVLAPDCFFTKSVSSDGVAVLLPACLFACIHIGLQVLAATAHVRLARALYLPFKRVLSSAGGGNACLSC